MTTGNCWQLTYIYCIRLIAIVKRIVLNLDHALKRIKSSLFIPYNVITISVKSAAGQDTIAPWLHTVHDGFVGWPQMAEIIC